MFDPMLRAFITRRLIVTAFGATARLQVSVRSRPSIVLHEPFYNHLITSNRVYDEILGTWLKKCYLLACHDLLAKLEPPDIILQFTS